MAAEFDKLIRRIDSAGFEEGANYTRKLRDELLARKLIPKRLDNTYISSEKTFATKLKDYRQK